MLYENMTKVEEIKYPLVKSPNGTYRQMPYDWRNFVVGKFYSDGDVLRYVLNLHEDFEDEDRIEGIYKLEKMHPQDIESSEWNLDDDKLEDFSSLNTQSPPIVIDRNGSIVDGGHRLEVAKQRGDDYILVFIPQ